MTPPNSYNALAATLFPAHWAEVLVMKLKLLSFIAKLLGVQFKVAALPLWHRSTNQKTVHLPTATTANGR